MELNYHDCFKVIGVDHKSYCLHSLTSGEATSAVSIILIFQKGYSNFMVDGSSILKDVHILADVSKRLQVTSQLGLFVN